MLQQWIEDWTWSRPHRAHPHLDPLRRSPPLVPPLSQLAMGDHRRYARLVLRPRAQSGRQHTRRHGDPRPGDHDLAGLLRRLRSRIQPIVAARQSRTIQFHGKTRISRTRAHGLPHGPQPPSRRTRSRRLVPHLRQSPQTRRRPRKAVLRHPERSRGARRRHLPVRRRHRDGEGGHPRRRRHHRRHPRRVDGGRLQHHRRQREPPDRRGTEGQGRRFSRRAVHRLHPRRRGRQPDLHDRRRPGGLRPDPPAARADGQEALLLRRPPAWACRPS